ncbi:MAG: hypothetical protein JXQ90_04365 [Cyclobacteriaceae bacterium]
MRDDQSLQEIKWPEVFSLAFLNVAIVISWIAYHEYQPVLIEKFEIADLVYFLVGAKAIILVITPPIAGLVADYFLKTKGKYFTVFSVGIGSTAMIFMVVASLIGAGPSELVNTMLPFMIVLWLVAMNLFISPANSMIDSFAPAKKIPIVAGFLFLITELVYALEPVVIDLVQFFGDTLTFIVGGVLIAGSGFVFHKVSSNEVMQRKQEMIHQQISKVSPMAYVSIIVIGLQLGLGKALLVEYFPYYVGILVPDAAASANVYALGILAFTAVFAFVFSFISTNINHTNGLLVGFGILLLGLFVGLMAMDLYTLILAASVLGISFGMLNVLGLPFVFKNLNLRHITYGVGIFIGASELFTGLIEYYISCQ